MNGKTSIAELYQLTYIANSNYYIYQFLQCEKIDTLLQNN